MVASPLENEQRLRQADNVLYYMKAGGKESPVLGSLILTNLRIAFAEVLPRKRGLLGKGESLRALINYKITRLIRADVVSRPTIRQPAPGKSVATDVQELLVVYLNTPTGTEDFAFEVPNPQDWSWAFNEIAMAEVEGLPPRSVGDAAGGADQTTMEGARGEVSTQPMAATTKKFCPECGKELELNTKFCWECGAVQPDNM